MRVHMIPVWLGPFLGRSRIRVAGTDIGLVTGDFYSHSVDDRAWTPTLLRSPRMAWGGGDPRTYAEAP